MPTARFFFAILPVVALAACGKGTPITSGTPSPPPTPPPQVTAQYPLPTKSAEPEGIALGADGNLWATEFRVSKLAQLVSSGSVSENATPTKNAGPYGIASGSGPNLNLWFTEANIGRVGQITVSGPPYVEYTIPASGSKPNGITLGSDGNMWVTDTGTNSLWKIQKLKHKPFIKFTQYVLTGNAHPTTITTGPDSALWFTEPGTNRIGRLPTSGYPLREYDIPTKNSDPVGIAPGSDGALWFTEQKGKQLGRISTGGVITAEYPLNGSMTPDQVVQGVDGNFYFTDTAANRIGQFFFRGHHVNYYGIPTKNSGPTALCIGLDQQIYFVETTGNKIAQFRYFSV